MQHGSTVSDRYDLVDTLTSHIYSLQTPVVYTTKGALTTQAGGVKLEDVNTIDGFWAWTEGAFITKLVSDGRVFVRTYNQVRVAYASPCSRAVPPCVAPHHPARTKVRSPPSAAPPTRAGGRIDQARDDAGGR
eukprot:2128643-Prymnesium_polylepis.1